MTDVDVDTMLKLVEEFVAYGRRPPLVAVRQMASLIREQREIISNFQGGDNGDMGRNHINVHA